MSPSKIGAPSRRPIVAAALLAAVTVLGVVVLDAAQASAQSSDVELSCAPETVGAGGTTTCDVAGVAASTRVTIEVRSAGTVVGRSSQVAGTDGRVAIEVAIPAATTPGPATLAIVGTNLTFDVTVTPGRPSGVSAGLSPSSLDLVREPPLGLVVSMMLALAVVIGFPRRARQD